VNQQDKTSLENICNVFSTIPDDRRERLLVFIEGAAFMANQPPTPPTAQQPHT